MKLIKRLSDMIEDELEGAHDYAKAALELKDTQPDLARALYNISAQEMDHMNILHQQVVDQINEYKKTRGDPPEAMMAVYDYLHAKHIDEAAEVKALQTLFTR